jgi:tetratricopeptide (TPR) repeat protein
MKQFSYKIFAFLFALIVSVGVSYAESSEQIFDKANHAYSKGKYSEAISGYKKIIANNECSGELYFNLGNAYYKLDSIPQAILYFEKAKLLIPNEDDLYTNLKLANYKTTDKIEAIPQLFFMNWYQNFLQSFTTNTWAWLSILACFISFLLFWLFVKSQKQNIKRFYFFGASMILIVCILLVIITSASNESKVAHRAVIFASSVTLKSEPSNSSTSLYVIHEGATCKIIEQVDNWLRVKLDNGNEGWLSKTDVKEI